PACLLSVRPPPPHVSLSLHDALPIWTSPAVSGWTGRRCASSSGPWACRRLSRHACWSCPPPPTPATRPAWSRAWTSSGARSAHEPGRAARGTEGTGAGPSAADGAPAPDAAQRPDAGVPDPAPGDHGTHGDPGYHGDKSGYLRRLKLIEGQVRGVHRMVDE